MTKTPLQSVETYDDGHVFERIDGRIDWVEDPKPPSPGQAKAGIHTQDITVCDDSGTKVKFRILSQSMHMDRSCKGSWFGFESTNTSGPLSGVTKTSWTNQSGTTYHNVEINGRARVFALMDQPATQQAPQQQAPQQQAPQQQAPQQQAPAPQQQQGAMEQLGNILLNKPQTVEDYAEQWISIYKVIQPMAESAGVPQSQWGPLATHIKLEYRNQPVAFRPGAFELNPPAQTEAQSESPASGQDESYKDAQFNGVAVFDLPHNELCALISELAGYKGKDPEKITQKYAAAKAMQSRNLSWAEVYDIFSGRLKREVPAESVDSVHDTMRKSMNMDDEKFYRTIIIDSEDFKSHVLGFDAQEK